MSESILSEFLEGAGEKPFRKLIQSHIRKQSTAKLHQTILWEMSNLPKIIQTEMESYIDAINVRFAYDKKFWDEATCLDAFTSFMFTAFEILPIGDKIKSIESSFHTDNQELVFNIFQISTLSFAYSASTQKKQRKFMGIRKGIFR